MTSPSERLEGTVDPKLLEILVCPVTKGPLEFDAAKQELISRSAKLAYPIRDGIPIMLPEEARKIDVSVLARTVNRSSHDAHSFSSASVPAIARDDKSYSASPFNSRGTSPDKPAAWRMNRFFSGGARSTRPRPISRTVRSSVDSLENSRFSELVASPIAMVSNRRQRW